MFINLLYFFVLNALAQTPTVNSLEKNYEQLGCYRLVFDVDAKISDYEYEISRGFPYEDKGILKTTKTKFSSTGLYMEGIRVKKTGFKKVRLKNGFDTKIMVYTESEATNAECDKIATQIRKLNNQVFEKKRKPK